MTASRNGIWFIDSVKEFDSVRYADCVLHILCMAGSMSFVFQEIRYNVMKGDYVILTNVSLASGFSESEDFDAVIMGLSESYVASMAIRSNYGIVGHLSLLQNPVMKLSARDFELCAEDLRLISGRMAGEAHHFREEMLEHLLSVHILDLYDIHVRRQPVRQIPERTAVLLRQFIELLYRGDFVRYRELDYYASRLFITPHYLSEICKKVSGKPATYWIDRFTLYEITRLLRRKEFPLAEIAERLHFSSLSYFSRYVQKRLGVPPSAYRNSFASGQSVSESPVLTTKKHFG